LLKFHFFLLKESHVGVFTTRRAILADTRIFMDWRRPPGVLLCQSFFFILFLIFLIKFSFETNFICPDPHKKIIGMFKLFPPLGQPHSHPHSNISLAIMNRLELKLLAVELFVSFFYPTEGTSVEATKTSGKKSQSIINHLRGFNISSLIPHSFVLIFNCRYCRFRSN